MLVQIWKSVIAITQIKLGFRIIESNIGRMHGLEKKKNTEGGKNKPEDVW